MKKIFTLTLTLVILSSAAFSQSFFARVSFNVPFLRITHMQRYNEAYSFTQYQRDNQIARINTEYNEKVRATMNLNIGAGKKIELIQQLQRGKANQIQAVNDRFFDARNKYNYQHYDRNYNWIR
ncbi:MAG TPA: hypothetical protein VHB70_12870 [Parafilimonas sp.]|nr:hypothetical protein [Parafilimonas sp.]